jgi:beta-lysine 5,6-aminomutase alpha subunit
VPLPNRIVESLRRGPSRARSGGGDGERHCSRGSPAGAAPLLADREEAARLSDHPGGRRSIEPLIAVARARIAANRRERERRLASHSEDERPLLYAIVATGNIHEDAIQAQAAARAGAQCIAVIRSTAQSLLDHVPFGATTSGFGGTFATQENFRIMRRALDAIETEIGRYVRLVNYCSGLCMPEIAAMGALERLDMMLNDALYGIIFRDINPRRTLIDQRFSRRINAAAGIVINTGEDNYLTTADAVEQAPAVLASQFINEALAEESGLETWQIGLGHAFEIDPALEDGLLFELAQAQMAREIFPDAPLKFMPPTKHMTGNVFRGYQQNALFVLTSVATGQSIHLLGMLTEALHTPFLHDRWLALDQARMIRGNARHRADEIEFRPNGRIVRRAHAALRGGRAPSRVGRGRRPVRGARARNVRDTRRPADGGRGFDGVVAKEEGYENPFAAMAGRQAAATSP